MAPSSMIQGTKNKNFLNTKDELQKIKIKLMKEVKSKLAQMIGSKNIINPKNILPNYFNFNKYRVFFYLLTVIIRKYGVDVSKV
jgi:hypothetical protein